MHTSAFWKISNKEQVLKGYPFQKKKKKSFYRFSTKKCFKKTGFKLSHISFK